MRKYLVIGCGGSGGATLRYMMDQLKADLSASGVDSLPAAWQFVHIDVPVAPEHGPGQLGSVPDQGGTYCSLSFPGANYRDVAAQVDSRFEATGAMNGLASWRPDPAKVTFPIVDGAGQYRAVGRTLTLARAHSEIMPALKSAWGRLQAPGVDREMQTLVNEFKVPGLGSIEPGEAPVVLVVSSVAGGSGASMVLDVARLLSMIDGVDPGLIAMFLYLPDAFLGLEPGARPGVEANGAAALAELIAAQANRASDTEDGDPGLLRGTADAFRAMGFVGWNRTRSFARVFPLGRSIGETGAILGDGMPDTVFRSLGRGMAALMMAGKATGDFVAYDLTNQEVRASTQQFGWGVDPSSLAWGSFGYASLSLGRDRYAEYAAQRLARSAIDHLCEGHRQAGDHRPDTEQVRVLVGQRLAGAQERVGLKTSQQEVKKWFTSTAGFPREQLRQEARSIVAELIDPLIRPEEAGNSPDMWLAALKNQVRSQQSRVDALIEDRMNSWAFAWHQGLTRRLEREVEDSVSLLGLPYTIRLLEDIRAENDRAAEELREAASGVVDPVALPVDLEVRVNSWQKVRGVLANPRALAELLSTGYRESMETALRLRAAALAARLLASLDEELIRPLEQACRDALQEVELARQAKPAAVGLAHVHSDDYAVWPAESTNVPERFANAENEILLTAPSEYPSRFGQHLRAEFPDTPSSELQLAPSRSIISGKWETVAGTRPPGGLLEPQAAWRPAELPTDPETGQAVLASRARYRVHVTTKEVLARARLYVDRPGEPFSRYTHESLREFLASPDLTDSERNERERLVRDKFRETLALARPVVGVSSAIVERLHGNPVRRRYKFGPVPFAGLPVEPMLLSILGEPAEGIEPTTISRFNENLVDRSPSARIDVFGSYELYMPLAFLSFLKPISSRWASTPEFGRRSFWQWRRARPLPEALPMGQDHRRALVAGWLLGEITGMVRVPRDFGAPGADPAAVWDVETGTWLPFLPNPGLVPRDAFHVPSDFLTAVLETMVIAIADSHESASLQPLRPYTALRRLYDSNDTPTPDVGMDLPVGAQHLERWIRSGETHSGQSLLGRDAKDWTPAQRREKTLELLTKVLPEAVTRKERDCTHRLLPDRPRILDLADDFRWSCAKLASFASNPPDLPEPLADDPIGRGGWV